MKPSTTISALHPEEGGKPRLEPLAREASFGRATPSSVSLEKNSISAPVHGFMDAFDPEEDLPARPGASGQSVNASGEVSGGAGETPSPTPKQASPSTPREAKNDTSQNSQAPVGTTSESGAGDADVNDNEDPLDGNAMSDRKSRRSKKRGANQRKRRSVVQVAADYVSAGTALPGKLAELFSHVAGRFALYGEDADEESQKVREERAEHMSEKVKVGMKFLYDKQRYTERLFDWNGFVLNPLHWYLTCWELLIAFLLIYSAWVVPYDAVFTLMVELDMLIFNTAIDTLFLIDLLAQFLIPYHNGTSYVRNHNMIANRYLRSWFCVDLVSVVPIDLIMQISAGGSARYLRALRLVRMAKLLRLAKLLKVLRSMQIFKKLEARTSVNYAFLNLVVLLVLLSFCSHWLACLWGFFIFVDPDATYGSAFELTDDDCEPLVCYQACMYWSVGLVTGMGHSGDSVYVHTQFLRTCYIFVMAMSGVANAYLIGGVVSLLERMNERRSAFYRDMDILNNFLTAHRIMDGEAVIDEKHVSGAVLCEKLPSYCIFKHTQGHLAESFHRIMFTCSGSLQDAIAGKLYSDQLKKIPFFVNAPRKFIASVAAHIQTHIFAAQERVFDIADDTDRLFIIERGIVFVKGKVLHKNDTFGEEVFYHTGRRGYAAVTLTDTVLLWIDAKDLKNAVEGSGGVFMRLRMKLISTILKMQKVARRAAVVTMNRRSFLAGYEVLQSEYSDYLLETPGSPIIMLWQEKINKTMDSLMLVVRQSVLGAVDPDMKARAHTLLLSEYDFEPGKISFAKVEQMRSVAHDYFHSLEKRAESKEKHRHNTAKMEISPLERFLTTPSNFDGQIMTQYLAFLSEQHMITLERLTQCTCQDLLMMGMPWGDCFRIVEGLKRWKEVDKEVTRERMSILASPNDWRQRSISNDKTGDSAPLDAAPGRGKENGVETRTLTIAEGDDAAPNPLAREAESAESWQQERSRMQVQMTALQQQVADLQMQLAATKQEAQSNHHSLESKLDLLLARAAALT